MWIMLLFRIIADVFRNHESSGFTKAAWLIFVILLPFLGSFVYIIVHGGDMGRREVQHAREREDAFRGYVKEVASSGTADELAKLAELRDRGVLTASEFEAQKATILV